MNIEDYCVAYNDYCRVQNIHEVCLTCIEICKDSYMSWDGQLPPEEFCSHFLMDPLWKIIVDLVNEHLEGN